MKIAGKVKDVCRSQKKKKKKKGQLCPGMCARHLASANRVLLPEGSLQRSLGQPPSDDNRQAHTYPGVGLLHPCLLFLWPPILSWFSSDLEDSSSLQGNPGFPVRPSTGVLQPMALLSSPCHFGFYLHLLCGSFLTGPLCFWTLLFQSSYIIARVCFPKCNGPQHFCPTSVPKSRGSSLSSN